MTDERDALRAQLDAQLAQVRPDFAAVLGRVETDPAMLPEAHVDLGEPPSEIAEACEALRARVQGALEERLASEPVPPQFRSRRWGLWVAAGVAVAAAVLLAVLGLGGQRWRQQTVDGASSLAADERRDDTPAGQVSQPPAPKPVVRPRPAPAPAPPTEALPEQPAPTETLEARPPKAREVPVEQRLRVLDARAQQRWAAGDLAGARKDFRAIVRIGGRRKQVELAYAELFALARQGGQPLPPLWRAYLRRFPKGRYAAEASAGLCRAASPQTRADCWSAHQARFGDASGARP